MMPAKQETQLEAHIDQALKKHDLHSLEAFLRNESSDISQKCSKQLTGKLDKLICRELGKKEVKNVSVVLNVMYKFAKSMTVNGEDWLTASIKQGLVEKSRDILAYGEKWRNESLIHLTEDFFDVLMIVHDQNDEGKIQILENFIPRVCSLVTDTALSIFIKQEAVRKLNLMLDTMPRDARKKILSTEDMMSIMSGMGKRILDAGDYDLQVAITEALCRMTSEKQRGEFARHWFPMQFVTEAFKGIKDSEFETDCRKFLNLVNGMLGDKRRVYTYPCLSVYLDNHRLQIPTDEKLEEFWIDFNLGTQSISFYVSTDDDGGDHQWETVYVTDSEVGLYNVEDVGNEKLLTVVLKTPATVGRKEGNEIRIYFDPLLDILDAAKKVFSAHKFKGFTKKQTPSVAKTAVHIIFDESGSQILVPESQESISSAQHVEVCNVKETMTENQPPSSTSSLHQRAQQEDTESNHSKLFTPKKTKVSEASIVIAISGGLKITNLAANTPTSRKLKIKPPLEMVTSAERSTVPVCAANRAGNEASHRRQTQHLQKPRSAADNTEIMQTAENERSLHKENSDEQADIVPDTQPFDKKSSSLLPGLTARYLGGHRNDNTGKQTSSRCQKEKASVPSGLNQVVSNKMTKEELFLSMTEIDKSSKQTRKSDICKNKNEEPAAACVSSATKAKEAKSAKNQKCKNNVDKESYSKAEVSSDKNDCNRAIEIPQICAQPELSAKKNNQVKARKGTLHFRTSEGSLESGFSAAGPKDREMTEKAKGFNDAAQSLINRIGSKYSIASLNKNSGEMTSARKNINNTRKSNKEKPQNRSFNQQNRDFSIAKEEPRTDVYNFQFSSTDDPTIKLGISSPLISKQKPTTALASATKSTEMKRKGKMENEKKANKNYHRKHLFSDTDTDRGADETKTDISWLQDPLSKKKPRVVGYSRHKPEKTTEGALQCEMREMKKNNPKEKTKPCKALKKHEERYTSYLSNLYDLRDIHKQNFPSLAKTKSQNKGTNREEHRTEQNRLQRPRRAVMKKASYKDLSNSEPESEAESAASSPTNQEAIKPPPEEYVIKKRLSIEKQTELEKSYPKKYVRKQPKTEAKTAEIKYKSIKIKTSPVSLPASPAPSIEQVRSEEDLSNAALRIRHQSVKKSLSPSLSVSSIEKTTPEKSRETSTQIFCSTEVKYTSKQWPKSSDKSINRTGKEKSLNSTSGKDLCSPASSLISMPSLTSLHLAQSAISGLNTELCTGEIPAHQYRENSLNTSTHVLNKELNKTEDHSSVSCQSGPGRIRSRGELPHTKVHQPVSTLKRIYGRDSDHEDAADEGDDHEAKRRKPKLLPRKLFHSEEKKEPPCRVPESLSTVSGMETSTIGADTWEGSGSDVGVLCQKISKEFTRKVQNRSRRIDYFTKQSLKSAQQHLSALGVQVRDYRIKRLDKFQGTILEEIENFEKDSQALKNMEKEFNNFWKQQTQAFSLYHKNEQKRIHHMKSSFEKNAFHCIDYEENIFNTEMHLMKDNMKQVQERLLKEMQEEELLSVRRGLQSLFMSGGRPF